MNQYQTEHIDDIFSKCKGTLWEVELSIIDACNRKCPSCPKSNDLLAPNTWLEMPPALYTKIANNLKEMNFDGLVMLCGYGEPLLSRNVVDIVKKFSFTYVDIITNGDCLTEEKAEELINAGVNKILISRYDNQDHYFDIQRQHPDKIIIRDRRVQVLGECNRGGTLNQAQLQSPCYYPFYMLMVDWNGDCFACCQDWQRHKKIGNLAFQSVSEVWNSQQVNKIRKMLKHEGRVEYPCKICNVNGTLRGEKNFEAYI